MSKSPIAIAVAFLLCGSQLNAQTVHLVLVPEMSDVNIREATQADATHISLLFQDNVSQNQLRTYSLEGERVTAASLQRKIQDVPANVQDTIVVYFSGHGAYNKQNGHYLQLAGNQFITRSRISSLIKSKGSRLGVLLTESCYGFDPDVPGMQTPGMIENFKTSPLFAKLFLSLEGFVDVNSCKEGQLAYTYPDTSRGSIFTTSFVESLKQLRNRSDLGWSEVLGAVGQRTTAEFKRNYPGGKTVRTSNGRVTQRSQSPTFVTPLDVRTRTVASRRPNVRIYRPPPEVNRLPNSTANTPRQNPPRNLPNLNQNNSRGPLAYTVRIPLGITMGPCEDPGIHIKTVKPNSPATQCVAVSTGAAGSLSPDDHILGINGIPVTTVEQVQKIVANANELTMRVRIRATGDILDVRTSLIRQRTISPKQVAGKPPVSDVNRPDRLGLVCFTCKDGVHVRNVVPGSPATRIPMGKNVVAINPGVHVISVAGRPVDNVEQYQLELQKAPRETWIQIKDDQGIVTPLTVTLAY